MLECNRLEEIKDLVEEELAKMRTNLTQNQKLASKGSVPNSKYQHMRLLELERQNQVLIYELRIHRLVLKHLNIDEGSVEFKIAEKEVNQGLQKQNLEYLQNENTQLKRRIVQKEEEDKFLRIEKEYLQNQQQILVRKVKVLQKKAQEYDKMGGNAKFQSLKDNIETLNKQNKLLAEQNKSMKQKINKITAKCKLLESLNNQTEEKLAEALVNNENSLMNTNKLNQNKELMAKKQQIRELKEKVAQLEKQKASLKQTHQQKEDIYCKMMLK